MPTYEYQCSACGNRFELIQKITEDPIKTCPKCGEEKAQRLISATAFHLKGSGWYKTDYSSSGSGGSSSGSNSSANQSGNQSGASGGSGNSTPTGKSSSSESSSSGTSAKSDSGSSNSAASNSAATTGSKKSD